MPTGYTSTIKDGISLNQFIMTCARAMGACITMRDDPFDAPIPDRFEPSDYHIKKIKEINNEIVLIQSLKEESLKERYEKEYNDNIKYVKQRIDETNELSNKYHEMLQLVRGWTPPSADHAGLKNFMIEQIESSIEWDCSTDYFEKLISGFPATPDVWKQSKMSRLIKDLTYHNKENISEIERVESRNRWIKQLRDSLKYKVGNR